MASLFAPAAKRSRTEDLQSTVCKKGKEHSIPWKDVCPDQISDWLDVFGKAHNTTREILLASILPPVASLMGPSKIKAESKINAESVNLLMICLCDPGAGKSPAFQKGCFEPVSHVEEKKKISLFVDQFTKAGLFSQLNEAPSHKAIIGKDEVSSFFKQFLTSSCESDKIDLERLNQLYDGSAWVYTKGDRTKRQTIKNPGVSLSGYSQPSHFFPIYDKLKRRQDGSVDRMIVYQPRPHRLATRETKEFMTKLKNSPVGDLGVIYSAIYEFSHSENGPAEYSLDQAGNVEYEKFVDKISTSLNNCWAENKSSEDVSKVDRHVLRLAAVLHVLYDQLGKFLREDPKSPPPKVISCTTLSRSIALCNYFTTQQQILDELVT